MASTTPEWKDEEERRLKKIAELTVKANKRTWKDILAVAGICIAITGSVVTGLSFVFASKGEAATLVAETKVQQEKISTNARDIQKNAERIADTAEELKKAIRESDERSMKALEQLQEDVRAIGRRWRVKVSREEDDE